MKKPPSLRASLARVMLLLAGLAVIAVGALIVLTTILHRTTESAAAATENVRLVTEAQVDLLLHERAADPLIRRDLEGSLRRRLAAARHFVTTEAEHGVLDRSDVMVDAYLTSANVSERQADRPQLHQQAYAALDELVSINVTQASHARREARRLDDAANIVGVAVSALLIFVAAGLALWLRRQFEPIFGLVQVMQRFGRGERDIRAEERGPAEMREMCHRFNEMAGAIVEQRQAQMAFLGGVVHDLRNPLSVLQLAVALIREDKPLPQEDKLRKIIERIQGQITRMNRMIGDFLDMAKIEAGELELRPQVHDVREIVQDVMNLFETGAPEPRFEVRVPDEPVLLRCDALRVEQVITNLVSNAIKYSPADTPIELTLRHDERQVEIRVKDEGFGIPEGDRKRLFEPFRRLSPSKDAAPGAGLGLFVVRKIIDAHGGQIDVESRLGQGSTFTVILPRGPHGESRAALSLARRRSGA